MKKNNFSRIRAVVAGLAFVASLTGLSSQSQAAATIVINNTNAAGVGFNDTTPAVPVGGNPGTTLGAQRLFAFTYAANIWGSTLTSTIPIVINARMTPLTCTSTTATLGSAGATSIFANFTGAPRADTWYPYALANKLSGAYLGTINAAQISANFNSNLGNPGCLDGSPFYLGLDHNHGTAVDFIEVLLHEMGHGIGFQTFTNGATGAFNSGFPSIWDYFLTDADLGLNWASMTSAQRAASSLKTGKLVWAGPLVTAAVPSVIGFGLPNLAVSGPAAGSGAGNYGIGTASFGAVVTTAAVTGQIMPAVEAGGSTLGCNPYTAVMKLSANRNIVLVDRGTCGFAVKAKNAQDAGAIGIIIANNVAGSPAPGLGGADPTVVIPAVSVTQLDGAKIRAQLALRSRTTSGVIGSISVDMSQRAGADAFNRMMMYAPNPFVGGSSVSHFDVSAFPNQLMEPAINGDLTQSVLPPQDLTFRLLQDIGW